MSQFVTVISDVHGQTWWKDVVAKRNGPVVFLGDYLDYRGDGPFAKDQIANFLEICAYARNNQDTVLLLGNHDFQYFAWARRKCPNRINKSAVECRKALEANLDILNIVRIWDRGETETPVIFSHAGVSKTFLERSGLDSPEMINDAWRRRPEIFDWQDTDDGYGDSVEQSPIWIRPQALFEDAIDGYTQVVGHTPVGAIEECEADNGMPVYLTCTHTADVLRMDIGEGQEWR